MFSEKSVLLVNPWVHDFAAYDYWSQPLGLLYLASFLRRNGLRTSFINCLDPFHPGMASEAARPRRYASGHGKFFQEEIARPAPLEHVPRKYKRYGIRPEVFRRALREIGPPRAVFVTSAMTYWYPGVAEAIRILREVHSGVPVALGGTYATLCGAHARKYSGADVIVAGDAESAMPGLLDLLGVAPSYLPDPDDPDSLPYPAFDLLNSPAQVPILTSRGCPFRCVYCASALLNRGFTRRGPFKVADEVEFWSRRGIRNFSLYDDAFLARPEEMALPLLKELGRRGTKCRFHCPNGLHLREVSREIAMLMKSSGFETLRFGFETAEPLRQAATGGKVKGEDLLRAVAHLKEAGYEASEIGVYLLCGLPNQPASEIRASIDFVKSCGARPLLAEFSPIPGTALWEDCRKSAKYDLEEPLFHNNTLLPCSAAEITPENFRGLKQYARI